MHQLSDETRATIEACLECHNICYAMLMTHCIETGGAHVRPQHVRLMMDCADICAAAANAMARKSQFHRQLCALCAEVCEACADDCEKLDGMEACVKTCRLCAQACRHMA
jgi:hypothetical protein